MPIVSVSCRSIHALASCVYGALMFGSTPIAPSSEADTLRALFTRLPAAIAVDVGPVVGRALAGGVRVARCRRRRRPGCASRGRSCPSARSCRRRRGRRSCRCAARPRSTCRSPAAANVLAVTWLAERRELAAPTRRVEPANCSCSGSQPLVAVVADAGVDRRAAQRPRVVHEGADRDRGWPRRSAGRARSACRRRSPSGKRRSPGSTRRCCRGDRCCRPTAAGSLPTTLLEQLGAHLEGVAALAGIEEVGRRAGVLLAVAIELPDLVGAIDHRAAGVAPRRSWRSCWRSTGSSSRSRRSALRDTACR